MGSRRPGSPPPPRHPGTGEGGGWAANKGGAGGVHHSPPPQADVEITVTPLKIPSSLSFIRIQDTGGCTSRWSKRHIHVIHVYSIRVQEKSVCPPREYIKMLCALGSFVCIRLRSRFGEARKCRCDFSVSADLPWRGAGASIPTASLAQWCMPSEGLPGRTSGRGSQLEKRCMESSSSARKCHCDFLGGAVLARCDFLDCVLRLFGVCI